MKNLLLSVFALIVFNTQGLLAQLPTGSVIPNVTLTDTEGNNWDLQDMVGSFPYYSFVFHFGSAEDPATWQYHSSGEMMDYYPTLNDNGPQDIMFFFMETNPSNSTDAIFGLTPESQGDFSDNCPYPIVDCDNEILAQFGITANSPSSFVQTVCFNGGFATPYSTTNDMYQVLDEMISDLTNCDVISYSVDLGTGNMVICDGTAQMRVYNWGYDTVTSFDYTVFVDGEPSVESWSGTLAPFDYALLEWSVDQGSETNIELGDDDFVDNNTSGTFTANYYTDISSHIRVYFETGSFGGFLQGQIYGFARTLDMYDYPFVGPVFFYLEENVTTEKNFYALTPGCYGLEFMNVGFDNVVISIFSVDQDGNETLIQSASLGNALENPAESSVGCSISIADIVPIALEGMVFHDVNTDGLHQVDEPGVGGVVVTCGQYSTVSDESGHYYFIDMTPVNEYTVGLGEISEVWTGTTTSSEITGSLYDGAVSFDFGLSNEQPVLDGLLSAQDPWFFCGASGAINFSITNTSNVAANATFSATLDPALVITAISPDPATQNGNIISWNVSDLAIGEAAHFDVGLLAPSFELMGETITSELSATLSSAGASDVVVNEIVESILYCSYDPNDIQGFPQGETEEHIIQDGIELEYLVRFQNTGNFQAFNIYVDDQLDTGLDYGSFEFLGASHSCNPVFNSSTGLLVVYFNDINLPDSTSNEPESHGWFRYRIHVRSNLQLGSLIENTAYIYFDSNPAVVTNTYVHLIGDIGWAESEMTEAGINYFPNPANNHITFIDQARRGWTSVVVTDLMGKVIFKEELNGRSFTTLTLGEIPAGLYFASFRNTEDQKVRSLRFVKQ
jgi:uncharacterized repeat protein (TIGR01451 family)